MSTDPIQRLIDGILAVINADATVQALTGRTGDICIEGQGDVLLTNDQQMPFLALYVYSAGIGGGIGRVWNVSFQLTALTAGSQAGSQAQHLLGAALNALTVTAFDAVGLDATITPGSLVRRGVTTDPQGPIMRAMAIGDGTVWFTE